MIAQGLSLGISKRELLEDYYPGELEAIFLEHNILHNPEAYIEEVHVDPLTFLSGLV